MAQDRCLCIDLRTVAQQLTLRYDEALADAGISVTQFSLLNLIRTLDDPTLSALARVSQQDRSTLGRNVKVLERSGFVKLQTGDDARTRTIHLTPAGRTAFKCAVPLWQATQRRFRDRLGNDGYRQLQALLTVLTDNPAAASEAGGPQENPHS